MPVHRPLPLERSSPSGTTLPAAARRCAAYAAPLRMTHREIRSWLMDMDGVLVHEEQAIPGAPSSSARCASAGIPFLVLTNNSIYTRRDLAARLRMSGLDVPEEAIWTSALATARFLEDQRPGGTAFVIGEAGLTTALHEAGYTLTERDPDYVVLGETRTYSLRAAHARDPADRGRRALHRHEPGPHRPVARGLAARHRLGRRADQPRDGRGAVLRRQAEPADDALRAERDRRALRAHGDDRRPDGHRRRLGPRGRACTRSSSSPASTTRGGGRALPLPRVADRRLGRRPDRRPRLRSGRPDSNRRPPAPKAGALPGCATSRWPRTMAEPNVASRLDRTGDDVSHRSCRLQGGWLASSPRLAAVLAVRCARLSSLPAASQAASKRTTRQACAGAELVARRGQPRRGPRRRPLPAQPRARRARAAAAARAAPAARRRRGATPTTWSRRSSSPTTTPDGDDFADRILGTGYARNARAGRSARTSPGRTGGARHGRARSTRVWMRSARPPGEHPAAPLPRDRHRHRARRAGRRRRRRHLHGGLRRPPLTQAPSGRAGRPSDRGGGGRSSSAAAVADITPLHALHYDLDRTGGLAAGRRAALRRHRRRRARRAGRPLPVQRRRDRPAAGPDGGDPYAHAAATLGDWRADGHRRRATPSRRCGRSSRTTPGPDGRRRTRHGLFARVRVEDYGPGRIRPHERTHPGPKEDRLRLTRATRANLSPIFSLYDGDAWSRGRAARSRARRTAR